MLWILRVERHGGASSHQLGDEREIRRVAAVAARDTSVVRIDGPRAMTKRELQPGAVRGAPFGLENVRDDSARGWEP
jgi:hypothetical protein